MERQLHAQLDKIREDLIRMGALVEDMIATATRALLEREPSIVQDVIEEDRQVDRMEMEIDEACHNMLVLGQPAAVDMRFLVAAMKITGDLERMGDSAVNIVQGARELNKEPVLKEYLDLPRMSKMTQEMVRNCLNAFVTRNAVEATAVCSADDQVDALYKKLFSELLGYMKTDPKNVQRAVHLLLICRNLERIADHATNIAEDVVYYVEGRDIRHAHAQSTR